MDYIKLTITLPPGAVDTAGDILLGLGVPGFEIQDSADFARYIVDKRIGADGVDQQLVRDISGRDAVICYLPDDADGRALADAIPPHLPQALEFIVETAREETWQDAWKTYYKPFEVGQRLLVCPVWEQPPEGGRIVLRMDPGMAFGTGTHESTRMCLELLDKLVRPGLRVLDIGTGSGILAIAALLLGAEYALGVDVDANSVRVAGENARANGVSPELRTGDLARGVDGTYDIVLANIVADVVMTLAPDLPRLLAPGGVFVASGIIDTRESDVRAVFDAAGLRVMDCVSMNGWRAITCAAG